MEHGDDEEKDQREESWGDGEEMENMGRAQLRKRKQVLTTRTVRFTSPSVDSSSTLRVLTRSSLLSASTTSTS